MRTHLVCATRLFFGLALVSGFGTPALAQQFADPLIHPVGHDAYGALAADFNADGVPDLAVANRDDQDVSILLGNGDGTFRAAVNYSAGRQPVALASGDFNGDGKLDLAVVNYTDGTVSILLGNGDGTFGLPINSAVGFKPAALAVADFNGDGKLDVATANLRDSVSVLLGNGDGTFQHQVFYGAGSDPVSIAAGDLNGDGKPGLVVANGASGNVSVLLNNGDGAFLPPVNYAVGTTPVSVVLADFNKDGKLDLATGNFFNLAGGGVTVRLGNGDGTFAPQASFGSFSGGYPTLTVEDFDADGNLDLAVGSPGVGGGVFTILFRDGSGDFPGRVNYLVVGSGGSIATADLNADGRPDVVLANFGANTATVDLNEGPGPPVVGLSPTSLTFATQVVGTTSASQTVSLTNTGTGALTISSITASNNFKQSNTCPSVVSLGASCTIKVAFAPQSGGKLTGSLTATDNASGGPQTVSLTGTGTIFTLTPTSLSFGSVPGGSSSPPLTATLSNVGHTSAKIVGLKLSDSVDFSQTNNCGSSLAAGASCSINVTFTPKSGGTYSQTLSVSGGGGTPLTVVLSGTGT